MRKKVISLWRFISLLAGCLCCSAIMRAQHCVPFVNHTGDNVSVRMDVIGDIHEVPLDSAIGLDEITSHTSDEIRPGALWGVTVNFKDVNMKKNQGPLQDLTVSVGNNTIDVSDTEKLNQVYRSIKDKSSCEEGGPLERFAVALFSDEVDEDTAELHDQGALLRRWYKTLLQDSGAGVTFASPKAERLKRLRGWFKGGSNTPQAFAGDDIESAVSAVQKRASETVPRGSSKRTAEEILFRTVQSKVVVFMEEDPFNKITQEELAKLYHVGKDVLTHIAQKASRDEFFALYWPIFYGFKLVIQTARYALEARSDNDTQGRTSLQRLQDQGLFDAYRTQLQEMIAWHTSVSTFSPMQSLALMVATYLDEMLRMQARRLPSFLSNPMKRSDSESDWVHAREEPDVLDSADN